MMSLPFTTIGPPFRCSATPSALPFVARCSSVMTSCSQRIFPVRTSSATMWPSVVGTNRRSP